MVQQVGEGSALPKGLSLFRFILFSCILLGGIYGGAALFFNEPPTSPLWLPTYVLTKFEIFIRLTAYGYHFPSRLNYALFASAAIAIGMAMGFLFGWFAGERARKWWIVHRGY